MFFVPNVIPRCRVFDVYLTQLLRMDYPILIIWMSPFSFGGGGGGQE